MENRIVQVRKLLTQEKVDALLVSSAVNMRYLTGFDGFHEYEREGYALITKEKLYILASALQAEGARNAVRNTQTKVIELTTQQKLVPSLKKIFTEEKITTVGFEENLTVAELKRLKKAGGKWKLTEEVVEEVRVIKDESELTSLKKACKLTDEAFTHALKQIRAGMTELDLAWVIEQYIRENGGTLAFPTIVAFDKHSAIPHHKSTSYKLKANSCILIDFGAQIDGYSADMTRTVFFGKPDAQFEKIYETVRTAQELPLLKSYVLNPKPEDIDKLARDYIISQDFPTIPHSVGHGVGLEVHELPHIAPNFDEEVAPNTPFTIEPGIYINGYGGVRIEDTVVFDGEKIIPLTKSPKNLLEI